MSKAADVTRVHMEKACMTDMAVPDVNPLDENSARNHDLQCLPEAKSSLNSLWSISR